MWIIAFTLGADAISKERDKLKIEGKVAPVAADCGFFDLHDMYNFTLSKRHLIGKSGAYLILHHAMHLFLARRYELDDKKIYILRSSSSLKMADRIMDHLINISTAMLCKPDKHPKRAIAKDGLSKFSVYVLEIQPISPGISAETALELAIRLTQLKQRDMAMFDTKYYINPKAKSRLGAKASEAIRELMSKLNTGKPIKPARFKNISIYASAQGQAKPRQLNKRITLMSRVRAYLVRL